MRVAVQLLAIFSTCAAVSLAARDCRADDHLDGARAAMRRAANYYHTEVAVHGGYVYHYTLDLKTRWGEGLAGDDQIWVQPPGTPTVGMAYLDAYEATGDAFYLEAARDTANALAYGQLRGGGWTNSIDTSGRRNGFRFSGGKQRAEGNCSLDDGQTQAAIQLLVRTDEALKFKDPAIHEAATFALDSLLKAQFANGGFPQVWREPVVKQPILKANYPKHDWRTEGRVKNYWDYYTTNDNIPGDVADALLVAHRVYDDERYLTALKSLGDFLILAQMPNPQPGWAQQYNYQMQPIWARKFEPAAIAGDESQEVIQTLLKITAATGDKKYLQPIPGALAYLKRSQLADGQLARFYELKTNKPLYMQREGKNYTLTYDDTKLPSHYGWKISSHLRKLQRRYEQLKEDPHTALSTNKNLAAQVKTIINELDDQGRWVSRYDGESLVGQPKFARNAHYLSSKRFSHNISILAAHLRSQR